MPVEPTKQRSDHSRIGAKLMPRTLDEAKFGSTIGRAHEVACV
jgi:hypothetical protein